MQYLEGARSHIFNRAPCENDGKCTSQPFPFYTKHSRLFLSQRLSTMKSSLASVSVIAACLSLGAEARTWQSAINSEIYRHTGVDTSRLQLKAELDPFFFPGEGDGVLVAPLEHDQASPTAAPQHASEWITMPPVTDEPSTSPSFVTDEPSTPPSYIPSQIPSDTPSLAPTAPTFEPTSRENNIDGNGGCHAGTVLYQVNMYDGWGDGWEASTVLKIEGIEDQNVQELPDFMASKTTTTNDGNTTVTITQTIELNPQEGLTAQATGLQVDPLGVLFQGSLQQGSHGTSDICLKPGRCYEVTVAGGDWEQEDSWDIRPVILGAEVQEQPAFVEGGAPVNCTFSIPDENGEVFCPVSCSATLSPEATGKILSNPVVVYTPKIEEYHDDATEAPTEDASLIEEYYDDDSTATDAPTEDASLIEEYYDDDNTATDAPTEYASLIEEYYDDDNTATDAPTEDGSLIEEYYDDDNTVTYAPTEDGSLIEVYYDDDNTATDAPTEDGSLIEEYYDDDNTATDAPTEDGSLIEEYYDDDWTSTYAPTEDGSLMPEYYDDDSTSTYAPTEDGSLMPEYYDDDSTATYAPTGTEAPVYIQRGRNVDPGLDDDQLEDVMTYLRADRGGNARW
jgi:hypothetical protein